MKKLWMFVCAALLPALPAHAEGVYGTVLGGLTWAQDDRVEDDGGADADLDFDAGFGVGLAAGYAWDSGVRAELETTYRRDGLDGEFDLGADIDGTAESWAVMANLLYQFRANDFGLGLISPYFGGGIGFNVLDIDDLEVADDRFTTQSETKFAFQLIAGAETQLTDALSLGLEYRYFSTEATLDIGDPEDHVRGLDFDSHNAFLTLRYRFDAL